MERFLLGEILPKNKTSKIKVWCSGQSQAWNAICKIKSQVDTCIFWKIGKGDIDSGYDNWSELGPLWKYLPPGSKPRMLKLKDAILDNHRNWDGWDIYLST